VQREGKTSESEVTFSAPTWGRRCLTQQSDGVSGASRRKADVSF